MMGTTLPARRESSSASVSVSLGGDSGIEPLPSGTEPLASGTDPLSRCLLPSFSPSTDALFPFLKVLLMAASTPPPPPPPALESESF